MRPAGRGTPLGSALPGTATDAVPARPRVLGVDVARGVALLGMMATHVFDEITDTGPTATAVVAAGRSAATFAFIAGLGVALLTGGRRASPAVPAPPPPRGSRPARCSSGRSVSCWASPPRST
jgi:Heparan-alpha-glucosaminide N-acetyltransferase, catalytic